VTTEGALHVRALASRHRHPVGLTRTAGVGKLIAQPASSNIACHAWCPSQTQGPADTGHKQGSVKLPPWKLCSCWLASE
jgi:hypothetical protein